MERKRCAQQYDRTNNQGKREGDRNEVKLQIDNRNLFKYSGGREDWLFETWV